ncbi:MAG: F0F1 ATP synthase subunit B [Candidatus Levyibacteriota bacterium]
MEILNQFGFEPVLFAAQIVNFLILAFVFKKFLYKPILKVLKERQRSIEKGLREAEEAHVTLAAAEEKKDAIIKAASKEAEEILGATKKGAEELKEQILTSAKLEAEKIISNARTQANLSMENVEKRAKKASLDNSMAILDKVLEKMFTRDEKEKILTRSVKTLKELD